MTNDQTLWITLRKHLPRKMWIPIADIFVVVQRRINLDAEDLKSINPHSKTPRWKSNVRRILHTKQRDGTISGRESK